MEIAPTIDPTVFHAYTRALAVEASAASRASSRTANGNVAPTQSVSGRSTAIESSAPGANALTETPSPRRLGQPIGAAECQPCAGPGRELRGAKPSAAARGVLAQRDATALPSAMPARKLASMVENAAVLPPRTWPNRRNQSTS